MLCFLCVLKAVLGWLSEKVKLQWHETLVPFFLFPTPLVKRSASRAPPSTFILLNMNQYTSTPLPFHCWSFSWYWFHAWAYTVYRKTNHSLDSDSAAVMRPPLISGWWLFGSSSPEREAFAGYRDTFQPILNCFIVLGKLKWLLLKCSVNSALLLPPPSRIWCISEMCPAVCSDTAVTMQQ